MARKIYSEDEIAAALVKLAVNKGNYNKTSRETGIPNMTLHRWQHNTTLPAAATGVGEKIQSVVEHLLDNVPQNLSGRDWAIALGILIDKYMIMNTGSDKDKKPSVEDENKELNDKAFFEELNRANSAVDRLSDGSKKPPSASK